MARILSTKKLLPNHKQYLLNAGLSIIEADFISIALKKPAAGAFNQNFIFTSSNAFKSFLASEEAMKYAGRKIFCVGSKTKEVIEQAGFKVEACEDYAEELAKVITESYREGTFTFFSGSMRRDTLPEALKNADVDFNEIEVYDTVLTPHEIKAPLDGLLFFSPSGVESYLQKNEIKNETCFCIGTTTAAALKGITVNLVTASKATVENVIVQCINYYKNI
ncbi:uroporphyrinogen III synthase [Flavobacterium cyanobacteriorum]|uniref:Uroporphyrinogen III synthase n=1 Tax=Flavobacterium cyanobacteriorum TaxID=2022802 RepID=A0A255ZA36_9FLAO|nr:uroporphyrinogen-III synthase [Flavobacterium cyanobacteriorum]OYQ38316.1 uroporphyrinogen III synthase [Flavobacterium cyanobacteriorum]